MVTTFSRRSALGLGIAALAHPLVGRAEDRTPVDLVDEPSRSALARYEVTHFGPPAERMLRGPFNFPADVGDGDLYGIDVSHHTEAVPWDALKASKVGFVYMKATQGSVARDPKFAEFWAAAGAAGVPRGAYHFMSAGIPGDVQARWFLDQVRAVGGLKSGDLQPVIDLEWDILGPDFRTTRVGEADGQPRWKDYWDDDPDAIPGVIRDCLAALVEGLRPVKIRPIIYTNRSWWEAHVPAAAEFQDTAIWIADYRQLSSESQAPRALPGYVTDLWQFADTGVISADGRTYQPLDCSKVLRGGMAGLTIP